MSPVRRPPLPEISVKARRQQDPGFLDLDPKSLDPSRHYRWVRCRSDEHMVTIMQTKLKGYSIERDREDGPKTVADLDKRPDKVIAVGDLILMSCPVELFNQRQRDQFDEREALFASVSAQTQEMAKEKGITLIADPDHNV